VLTLLTIIVMVCEGASKVCSCQVCFAVEDVELFIGALWKNFQASVRLSARAWWLLTLHYKSVVLGFGHCVLLLDGSVVNVCIGNT
jgi:hypothetical protein